MSFLKIERLNNMKGNNLVQFDKLILTKLIEESVRQDSLNLYLTSILIILFMFINLNPLFICLITALLITELG